MEVTLATICEEYIKNNDYFGIASLFVNIESVAMMSFFYNPKNKRSIDSFYENVASQGLFFPKEILQREYDALFERYENFSSSRNKIRIKYMKLLCQCTLIYLLQDYKVKDFIKEQPSDLKTITAPNSYFRGQANYEWRMTPSIVRNLPFNALIDYNFLINRYRNIGLLQKYYMIFKVPVLAEPFLDYEMLAFMQHAVSYSPFLDFTKEFRIARNFALSNPNQFNVFANTDSSVYWVRNNTGEPELTKKRD